jgi:lambda family phage portal protein
MNKSWRSVAKKWWAAIKSPKRGLYDAVSSSLDIMGFAGGGGYAVLDPTRKILTGLTKALRSYSANELANLSLSQLRSLCRKLERDNATARAACEGLAAQVVGTGIGISADTGNPAHDALINEGIKEWLATCDITATRSIYELQTEAYRAWHTAGEHLWRMVILPERIDQGLIPVAILPLESEWIAAGDPPTTVNGITRANGMDLDLWGRPIAYWLANPEMGADNIPQRIPASEIIHGFEVRRALQNRGEPTLTPVIERIFQEGDLIDTELKAAINCSAMAVVITSPHHGALDDGSNSNQQTDGTSSDPAVDIPVGSTVRLVPGEDAKAFTHDRPSQQIAPFTEMLRGSIAAACRTSRRWLDKDYSKANFSSMRADNLDADRMLAPVTERLGHTTIGAVYKIILPYICIKKGIPVPKSKRYKLLPDGQAYVNPKQDIEAISMALASGLTTHEKEASKRGEDYLEIWKQLAKEKKEAATLGLTLDPSGTNAPPRDSAEVVSDDPENQTDDNDDNQPQAEKNTADRMQSLQRSINSLSKKVNAERQIIVKPTIHVAAPQIRNEINPAPVHVAAPQVHNEINPTPVHVSVAAPVVNVAAPQVHNEINPTPVHISTPDVTVKNEVIVPQRTIKAIPQRDGSVIMEPQE